MAEQPKVPRREVRDPGVLRALSHPLRLTLLEELANLGQATATELAERTGESPANCSWHLRQLAKYDLIEEGTGGAGRQRPWRWINQSIEVGDSADDDAPEFTHARDGLLDVLLSREVEALRAWMATKDTAPAEWSEASSVTQSLHWMTLRELAEFKAELQALVERHILNRLDRADPQNRPEGSQPVRFVAWSIPARPAPELPSDNPPSPEEDT